MHVRIVHILLTLHECVLLGDAAAHVRHLLGVESVRRVRRAVRGAVLAEPLGERHRLGRRRERRDARAFLQVQVVDAPRRLAHLAELVDLGALTRRAHRALRARVAHQLGVHRRLHAVNALVHVGLLPKHVLATHVRALVERVERGDAHRAGKGVPEPREGWTRRGSRRAGAHDSAAAGRGFSEATETTIFKVRSSARRSVDPKASRARVEQASRIWGLARRKISREAVLAVCGDFFFRVEKIDRL